MKLALVLFFSGVILIVALWQLEMIFIANEVSWGYDFGGFGSLGLENYQWRDFWYLVLFLNHLLVVCVYILRFN